jgi:hypothetical protein
VRAPQELTDALALVDGRAVVFPLMSGLAIGVAAFLLAKSALTYP